MFSYYRIHKSTEPLETLLDADRKDGWVADDETVATQPRGISCCNDLDTLRGYVREYSMSVRPGDQLVRVIGALSYDRDRDNRAVRVLVESYEVVGDASEWLAGRLEVES